MSRRKSRLDFRQVGRTRKESMLLVFSTVLYFIGVIFWLELTFHFVMYGSFGLSFLFPVLFSIPIGGFFGLLCNLTPSKPVNYWITCGLTVFCCVIFGANVVYHEVFQTYIGVFSTLVQGNATKALTFGPFLQRALVGIWENIFGIILIAIPIIFIFTVGRSLLSFRQRALPVQGLVAGGVVLAHVFMLLIVNFGGRDMYSPYDLYHHNSSLEEGIETLGVATSMRLDLRSLVFGSGTGLDNLDLPENNGWQNPTQASGGSKATSGASEPDLEQTPAETTEPATEPDIHDQYQFVDIDFDRLIAEAEAEGNGDLVTMHKYFQGISPTATNEYTGIYEGYNLIFITAEGFSPYAVDEDLTPTLYKLVNTGYVFNNFYTPLWFGSTSAGEYVNLVSQFPKDGGEVYVQETGRRGTDMYFSLGRLMERAGYNLWGFHNNDYSYYDRDKSHPNMGYENWIGTGSGYEPEKNSYGNDIWPQSDLHLIDTTFDTYAGEEPFHVYYMTVSGHMYYSFSGNSMSARNREAVKDLPLSETAQAYIACHIELDKALESLIQKLEESGLADRTLLVMSADHIPYDDEEMCDEIAAYQMKKAGQEVEDGFELDRAFDLYRNNLIIWTGSMEEGKNVVVDKPCYSLDILPTIANMLGIEYDSRILMGRDIFSDEPGLVIFNRGIFITDQYRFNNGTKEATPINGAVYSEDDVSNMRKAVRNKLAISRQIVDMNYYSYLH